MAEKLYPHADQHVVEVHAHDDPIAQTRNHVPKVKQGEFPHVKRAEDGSWHPCDEAEADGKIVGEIAVVAGLAAINPGRNPATGDIHPGSPAIPPHRKKVHIAIHEHRIEAIKAALGHKED